MSVLRRAAVLAPAPLVLVLAGCPSFLTDSGAPRPAPALGVLEIAPSGARPVSWRVTEAALYPPADGGTESFLSLGGPEDATASTMAWRLSVPVEGALSVGTRVDLKPVEQAHGYVRQASFSGGVLVGGDCGTPSWQYASVAGTLVVTAVAAGTVSGTVDAVVDAPYDGPFGRRVTVRTAFRATVAP